MKISKSIESIINKQINHEMVSAYIYLAMSAWFETTPFKGFAKWMNEQNKEETVHAMKFYSYLINRGGVVDLDVIQKPKAAYRTPLEAFQVAFAHEQKITSSIHQIYAMAEAERDYETLEFLSWFLKEQVEEEKTVEDILALLHLAGDHPGALMQIDAKLGASRG